MTKKPEDIAVMAATNRPFFSLNGNYSIDQGNTIDNLGSDIGCMLESCRAVIQTVINGMTDQSSSMSATAHRDVPALLFGVLYQLEMIDNMNDAICTIGMKNEQTT